MSKTSAARLREEQEELLYQQMVRREAEKDRAAWAEVSALIEALADKVAPVWKFGDGTGGSVKMALRKAIEARGLEWEFRPTKTPAELLRKRVSRHTRDMVIARDGLICCYCKSELHPSKVTLDHKIALVNGGTDEAENLTVSCRSCNSRKGAK